MSRLLSTDTNHMAVEAGYDKGDLFGLKEWLYDEHNIEVNSFTFMSVDPYKDTEEVGYSYTTNNWEVKWSVHDGTGAVMPEHYHGDGSTYWEALDLGLRKGLEILMKRQSENE